MPTLTTAVPVTVRTFLLAVVGNGSSAGDSAGTGHAFTRDDLYPQHPVGEVGRIERELEAGHHARRPGPSPPPPTFPPPPTLLRRP